jgi:hypothetical protein
MHNACISPMNDRRIIQLNEAELYPMAQKYLVRYSRLDSSNEKHQRMMQEAEKARMSGLAGIDIRAVAAYWDGDCIKGGTLKKDGIELTCRAFSQIPDGAVKRIYAFVVTAGECLFNDSDPIIGQLFADTWGTAYVDVARLLLRDAFRADMESAFPGEDVSLSAYFGPGFYGMPMTESIRLNQLLSAEAIGIHTRESGLMIPVKSSSGFYLATCDPESLPGESCEECVGNSKGCAYCLSRKKNIGKEE